MLGEPLDSNAVNMQQFSFWQFRLFWATQERGRSILSIADVGVYKPHPRVYQLAVDKLGVAAENISFQSANAWDAAGAASFGFPVV